MEQFTHSVMLDKELCMGCINCIKRCPTEAIRVRDGKAHILKERCIDCGECIRICPHHAKKAITDPISILENFQYTMPSRSSSSRSCSSKLLFCPYKLGGGRAMV